MTLSSPHAKQELTLSRQGVFNSRPPNRGPEQPLDDLTPPEEHIKRGLLHSHPPIFYQIFAQGQEDTMEGEADPKDLSNVVKP